MLQARSSQVIQAHLSLDDPVCPAQVRTLHTTDSHSGSPSRGADVKEGCFNDVHTAPVCCLPSTQRSNFPDSLSVRAQVYGLHVTI